MEQSSDLLNKIKEATQELRELKERFSFYQRCQVINREYLLVADPYDELPKEYYETEIHYCRFTLNVMQKEIKELRAKLKKLQREYNELQAVS